MPSLQSTHKQPLNKLKEYDILDYWAITNVVYRIAVRQEQHLEPLANHLAKTLGSEGFRIKSFEWSKDAPNPYGLILLTYEGTKIAYNFLGEANRYDMLVMAQVLEAMVKQYYQLQD